MVSPLGPFLANILMSSIENKLMMVRYLEDVMYMCKYLQLSLLKEIAA